MVLLHLFINNLRPHSAFIDSLQRIYRHLHFNCLNKFINQKYVYIEMELNSIFFLHENACYILIY